MKKPPRENFLTDAELRRLFRAIRETRGFHARRDELALGLMIHAGLRPAEVVKVRKGDLLSYSEPAVVRVHTAKRKDHLRDQPVPDFLMHRLETWAATLKPESYLFISAWTEPDRPVTTRALRDGFDRYAHRAKIEERSLYSLRHTYATRILETTLSPVAVRDLLGHASLASTDRYVAFRDKRKAVESLEDV